MSDMDVDTPGKGTDTRLSIHQARKTREDEKDLKVEMKRKRTYNEGPSVKTHH